MAKNKTAEKVGRPAFQITKAVIRKTEKLASQGLTKKQIARVIGICYSTLNEKTKEFKEFSDAIKDGQAKGVETISNALFDNAKKGNTTAQIFYLKNRSPDDWSDRHNHELTGKDGAPLAQQTVIILPAKNENDNQ